MPSGLISTSSNGMGFISTAATSGEKGTVDSPWKELDQSMPLSPEGAAGVANTGLENAVGASGMEFMPCGGEYGADGAGLVCDSAKGVLVFLAVEEEGVGFAAELLLLLFVVVAANVVADRL